MMIGLGLAATGLGIRVAVKNWRNMQKLSQITGTSPFTHYYKGGFETKMSRREAALILGVRQVSYDMI